MGQSSETLTQGGHMHTLIHMHTLRTGLCFPEDPFLSSLNPGPFHSQNWQQAARIVLPAH